MTKPRLLLRTHYQVDEPATLRWLILDCSSPIRSAYPERAAECLAKRSQASGRKLNTAAGRYAVDLARDLNLLNENITWTDQAHTINALRSEAHPSDSWELSITEKLLFFRFFLEGDGAALVFLARRFANDVQMPPPNVTWASLANEMVVEVLTEHLEHTSDPVDRIRLRHLIDKRRAKPYLGKSGPHQMFVHLQTLARIGLLYRDEDSASRTYSANPRLIAKFLAKVPNIAALETFVKKNSLVALAGDILSECLPRSTQSRTPLGDVELAAHFREIYDRIIETGVSLCPIAPLAETLQIRRLVDGGTALEYDEIIQALERLRKQEPREVRFHVDRSGNPAFVKLGPSIR